LATISLDLLDLGLCIVAPSGTSATEHLSSSSSVLRCRLHLSPALLETNVVHISFSRSLFQVLFVLHSFSVVLHCPLGYSACLAISSSLLLGICPSHFLVLVGPPRPPGQFSFITLCWLLCSASQRIYITIHLALYYRYSKELPFLILFVIYTTLFTTNGRKQKEKKEKKEKVIFSCIVSIFLLFLFVNLFLVYATAGGEFKKRLSTDKGFSHNHLVYVDKLSCVYNMLQLQERQFLCIDTMPQ